jgi:hypothetical protein
MALDPTIEAILREIRGAGQAASQPAGRITAEEYAAAERRAAERAAEVARSQVERGPGVRAAEEYLSRGAGKAAATRGARRLSAGAAAKFIGKRVLGPAGLGLLAYEALQGGAKLGAGLAAPERPSFIPPEVHAQLMERLGENGYDLLRGKFTGEPVGPLEPRSIQFPALKGSIPSAQPEAGEPAPEPRRPVNLNAIDNPDIPIERGTGVIRNERTGRVFAIDARDTVNQQYDGVLGPARVTLPATGFSDIDAAMPGMVMAAIKMRRESAANAAQAAQAEEGRKFAQQLVVERMKASTPVTKIIEPVTPGGVPQVVTANPLTGAATVQAATPPGMDLQSLDASSRQRAAERPDQLDKINALRRNYGLTEDIKE